MKKSFFFLMAVKKKLLKSDKHQLILMFSLLVVLFQWLVTLSEQGDRFELDTLVPIALKK